MPSANCSKNILIQKGNMTHFRWMTVIQDMISLIAASFKASIILNTDSLTQFRL